jgi:hypothetical protein
MLRLSHCHCLEWHSSSSFLGRSVEFGLCAEPVINVVAICPATLFIERIAACGASLGT